MLKPINRKTSPGYLFSDYVTPKTPGKTAFFGHEGPLIGDKEIVPGTPLGELHDCVSGIVEDARNGIRNLHICTDFLKDELRPLHKVEQVATRVISGTCIAYTIAVRMYFGAFLAAMFATHVKNGMAPGVNHYTEWCDLAHGLLSDGRVKVFDGDFSRFDASEQPWVHDAILRYIERWYEFNNASYKPEDRRIRAILWLDLVHSRHVTGVGNQLRYLVQWNKSLPSGHPLTTMVNSMYSLITLTACYMRATGDHTNMWDHAFINTFGDDNITSVDDEVCDLFNQVTVQDMMTDMFDLAYTAGNKSGRVVPYTTIDNVTFLKRTFVRDEDGENSLIGCKVNHGWVAPLDPASFLYEPYWYKSTRDPVKDLVTRIEHCLGEMSLHDESYWNEKFPLLERWCHRNGVPLKLTSRSTARAAIKSRLDVWF
jgi:hypothetical protein